MKKLFVGGSYVGRLIIIDLLAFFLIYFLHAVLLKGFPIMEAATKGGYELLWRVVSLQLVIQALLCLMLALWGLQKYLFFVLAAGVISMIIAVWVVYSASHIPKLLTLPSADEIGVGFAIVVSLTLAWLSMKRIS